MPTYQELRLKYQEAMGKELGAAYHLLWNRCVQLHIRWGYYCELFGKSQEEFDIMNRTAPQLFKVIQDALFEGILLDLAKFCDPLRIAGGKKPLALSLLASLVPGQTIGGLSESITEVQTKTAFARDWRNRHIAHWDYQHLLDKQANQLKSASRASVSEAINAIDRTLETIDHHFTGATLCFDVSSVQATHLIRELKFVQTLRDERKARMRSGLETEDDSNWNKWH